MKRSTSFSLFLVLGLFLCSGLKAEFTRLPRFAHRTLIAPLQVMASTDLQRRGEALSAPAHLWTWLATLESIEKEEHLKARLKEIHIWFIDHKATPIYPREYEDREQDGVEERMETWEEMLEDIGEKIASAQEKYSGEEEMESNRFQPLEIAFLQKRKETILHTQEQEHRIAAFLHQSQRTAELRSKAELPAENSADYALLLTLRTTQKEYEQFINRKRSQLIHDLKLIQAPSQTSKFNGAMQEEITSLKQAALLYQKDPSNKNMSAFVRAYERTVLFTCKAPATWGDISRASTMQVVWAMQGLVASSLISFFWYHIATFDGQDLQTHVRQWFENLQSHLYQFFASPTVVKTAGATAVVGAMGYAFTRHITQRLKRGANLGVLHSQTQAAETFSFDVPDTTRIFASTISALDCKNLLSTRSVD